MSDTLGGALEFEFELKTAKLESEVKQAESKINNMGKNVEKSGSSMEKTFEKVAAAAATYFTFEALKGLVTSIITVRSEFEKYQAVLTTSYGSSEKATKAMTMLTDIASSTPFQLTELTGAFVKLKNQGFEPTRAEIIKLGDLASSTGKGFDMLAEAILDAQTGEFERLKEFGIKAKQNGDKVTLSFKGQKTTIDNTSESLKQYIVSLGAMEGVTGSMAAISDTLGGKVSNLGDAYDALLNTLGKSDGWKTAISGITDFIEKTTMFAKGSNQVNTETATSEVDKLLDSVKGMSETDAFKVITDRIANLDQATQRLGESVQKNKKWFDVLFFGGSSSQQKALDKGTLDIYTKQLNSLKQVLADPNWSKKINPDVTVKPEVLGIIEKLQKQLKNVQAQRDKATSDNVILQNNKEITSLKNLIDYYETYDKFTRKKGPQALTAKSALVFSSDAEIEANRKTDLAIRQGVTGSVYKKTLYSDILGLNSDTVSHSALSKTTDLLKKQNDIVTEYQDKYRSDWEQAQMQIIQLNDKYSAAHLAKDANYYNELDSIMQATYDKTYDNLMKVGDALQGVFSTIGGDFGKSMGSLVNSSQAAYTSIMQIGKAGASSMAQIAGGVALIGAGMEFVNKGNDLLSGSSKNAAEAAKRQAEYFQQQGQWLDYINNQIRRQIDLTKELNGEVKVSGTQSAIKATAEDVESLKKRAIEAARINTGDSKIVGTTKFLGQTFGGHREDIYADMSKRTIEEIQKIAKEANANGGKVEGIGIIGKDDLDNLNKYLQSYEDGLKQIKELQNRLSAELTGSTYDSIVTSLKDAFSDGILSAEEFTSSFEDLMKKAVLNSFQRSFLDTQLQGWYDSFATASEGGLTADEIATLKTSLNTITSSAQTGLNDLMQASGLDLSTKATSDSSTLSGAIKSTITEDTASLVAGQMNAIRLSVIEQKTIAMQSYQQLVMIEANTRPISEIRDLVKSGNSNSLTNNRANGI